MKNVWLLLTHLGIDPEPIPKDFQWGTNHSFISEINMNVLAEDCHCNLTLPHSHHYKYLVDDNCCL